MKKEKEMTREEMIAFLQAEIDKNSHVYEEIDEITLAIMQSETATKH